MEASKKPPSLSSTLAFIGPAKPVDEKDDQKSNTDAEKQSNDKSSSPSFGFFDFSSSNDKKDDSNEENGSNKDKKEK